MRPQPALSPEALRQLRRFPVRRQRKLVDAIRLRLWQEDPSERTRNRFRLRRPSSHADYELRVEDMRVFYRISENGGVVVGLIGVKRRNKLVVEGNEFDL